MTDVVGSMQTMIPVDSMQRSVEFNFALSLNHSYKGQVQNLYVDWGRHRGREGGVRRQVLESQDGHVPVS